MLRSLASRTIAEPADSSISLLTVPGTIEMKKILAALIAAAFATGVAYAADAKKEEKKPTAEECKKDPKMKGCEPAKK
jgi:hypothetical protein